ncbi:MAG: hypothetical protein IJU15_04220 [Synergistaceae bacterium]|nr:hypothetical protein [Synergistaceae bacterium]
MIACLYNALLWSMLITVANLQNEWFDMRVNTGGIFFAVAFVLALLFSMIKPLRKKLNSFAMCFFSLVITCAGLCYLLGVEGLPVIPASVIREGLMQNHLDFHVINIALIAAALGGLILTLFTTKYER